MKSDISRISFDHRKNYTAVTLQQGRPLLDADKNEHDACIYRLLRTMSMDITGLDCVVSGHTPDAFKIIKYSEGFYIGKGRMYVDGLLAENHNDAPFHFDPTLEELTGNERITYDKQPDYPQPLELPEQGYWLAYLDVRRQDISHLIDPDIVEKAVGVDTTNRQKTLWQVKFLKLDVNHPPDCITINDLPEWRELIQSSAGRLTTSTGPSSDDNPCKISPGAGYRDDENRTYRFEIHDGGPLAVATGKWSRVNATVASHVLNISPTRDQIEIADLGRDAYLCFKIQEWIEILDDHLELHGKPGFMTKIIDINEKRRLLTIDPPIPDTSDFVPDDTNRHTRVIRWDQKLDLNDAGLINVISGKINLEDGIQVELSIDQDHPNGKFKTGDYWIFEARASDGSVKFLDQSPPLGIHHHYCKLAILHSQDGEIEVLHDCRNFFSKPVEKPVEPSIHIEKVLHFHEQAQKPLLNDSDIYHSLLAEGLHIQCDTDLATILLKDKPVCIVTLEIPYPLADFSYIGVDQTKLVGYQPIVLAATVSMHGKFLTWTPKDDTKAWLEDTISTLFALMEERQWGDRLLARLKVMGNFIWAQDNPNKYLDAQTFGIKADNMMHIQYPSGDGQKGGDFDMWFWLVRQ